MPEHQFSLWTDYRFDSGIKAGLGVRYVGSTRGFGESAPIPVPDYTLIDAMFGYLWGTGSWRSTAAISTTRSYSAPTATQAVASTTAAAK